MLASSFKVANSLQTKLPLGTSGQKRPRQRTSKAMQIAPLPTGQPEFNSQGPQGQETSLGYHLVMSTHGYWKWLIHSEFSWVFPLIPWWFSVLAMLVYQRVNICETNPSSKTRLTIPKFVWPRTQYLHEWARAATCYHIGGVEALPQEQVTRNAAKHPDSWC